MRKDDEPRSYDPMEMNTSIIRRLIFFIEGVKPSLFYGSSHEPPLLITQYEVCILCGCHIYRRFFKLPIFITNRGYFEPPMFIRGSFEPRYWNSHYGGSYFFKICWVISMIQHIYDASYFLFLRFFWTSFKSLIYYEGYFCESFLTHINDRRCDTFRFIDGGSHEPPLLIPQLRGIFFANIHTLNRRCETSYLLLRFFQTSLALIIVRGFVGCWPTKITLPVVILEVLLNLVFHPLVMREYLGFTTQILWKWQAS